MSKRMFSLYLCSFPLWNLCSQPYKSKAKHLSAILRLTCCNFPSDIATYQTGTILFKNLLCC